MSDVRSSSVLSYFASSKVKTKQSFEVKDQINDTNDLEASVSSLQIVLEEKNRVIDKLKKQLNNQRIQLEFYIKKELNNPLMIDLAKTCLPELTDDNMTVALAMNKFYKELGMKSRIMSLYDKVCLVVGRTNCIIQTQEVILNEIISNLRKYMNPNELKKFLGNFDINTNYIEVFNTLLETTLSLKNSMNTFRSCCDKLIHAEEKRNEIVEHVYSLPQEERTICNYLVNIQMEKCELECAVKELSKFRKKNEPSMDEIDVIENNLKLLRDNFSNIFEEEESNLQLPPQLNVPTENPTELCVTKMLEKVYSQAMSLLSVSREQREKFSKEIEQVREENKKLREIIQHVDHKTSVTRGQADFADVEKLHGVIKKTISEARKFEKTKLDELKQKTQECEDLKQQLQDMTLQKLHLQKILESDSSEFNEFFLEREVKLSCTTGGTS